MHYTAVVLRNIYVFTDNPECLVANGVTTAFSLHPIRGQFGGLIIIATIMEFKKVNGGFNVTFSWERLAEQAMCLIVGGAFVFEMFWFGAEQQCLIP